MTDLKSLLTDFDLSIIFLALFTILSAAKILWETLSYFAGKFGWESKSSRHYNYHHKKITEHDQSIDNINKILDELRVAIMATLADRINQKYKYYLRISGIPTDEFDEFVQMHDAYKGVGGNHTIDEKFSKAMKFHIYTARDMVDKGLH